MTAPRSSPRYASWWNSREGVGRSVTGADDRPGDEIPPTRITDLPEAERTVLAALAIVGRASLSADELRELAKVDDVAPLLDDLKRRGLIEGEQKRRYSTAGRIGEEIRKTDDALSTGERLLQYVTTLAKGGKLTPERLLDDAEAVLGLSEWAAEMERWEGLLELVKTVQAGFEIAHRVEELVALLERGRTAARALKDWRSEVWVLQRLGATSASAGDHTAAQQHLREADELISTKCRPVIGNGPGIPKWVLCSLAAAAVAAGGTIGWAIGSSSDSSANAGQERTNLTVTTIIDGHTVTVNKTVTLPIRTVTKTVPEAPSTGATGSQSSTGGTGSQSSTGPSAHSATSGESTTGPPASSTTPER
jgi:hypothetical protein